MSHLLRDEYHIRRFQGRGAHALECAGGKTEGVDRAMPRDDRCINRAVRRDIAFNSVVKVGLHRGLVPKSVGEYDRHTTVSRLRHVRHHLHIRWREDFATPRCKMSRKTFRFVSAGEMVGGLSTSTIRAAPGWYRVRCSGASWVTSAALHAKQSAWLRHA